MAEMGKPLAQISCIGPLVSYKTQAMRGFPSHSASRFLDVEKSKLYSWLIPSVSDNQNSNCLGQPT